MTRPARSPVTVRDLMTSPVVSINPDLPVSGAVELLADAHVSGLAVIDLHDRLLGVVTTSDVVNAGAEAGDNQARRQLWSEGTVRDIMTSRVLTASPDLEIREAALQMEYGEVHRLFVVEDGKLIGVVSRSDISRAFAAGRIA